MVITFGGGLRVMSCGHAVKRLEVVMARVLIRVASG